MHRISATGSWLGLLSAFRLAPVSTCPGTVGGGGGLKRFLGRGMWLAGKLADHVEVRRRYWSSADAVGATLETARAAAGTLQRVEEVQGQRHVEVEPAVAVAAVEDHPDVVRLAG